MSYKIPSVGDLVLYFANGGDCFCQTIANRPLPAITTTVDGSHINLSVFTGNNEAPIVLRKTVVHRIEVMDKQGKPEYERPYWTWPGE